MKLSLGMKYVSETVVGEENTAVTMGSGDLPVFATPAMVALMENAAMLAVASALEGGDTTVGGHIESSHLRPTPVGAEVSATATLEKVEGRKLYFKIIAHQGDVVIGEGTHLRFIVNREKFLAKIL